MCLVNCEGKQSASNSIDWQKETITKPKMDLELKDSPQSTLRPTKGRAEEKWRLNRKQGKVASARCQLPAATADYLQTQQSGIKPCVGSMTQQNPCWRSWSDQRWWLARCPVRFVGRRQLSERAERSALLWPHLASAALMFSLLENHQDLKIFKVRCRRSQTGWKV